MHWCITGREHPSLSYVDRKQATVKIVIIEHYNEYDFFLVYFCLIAKLGTVAGWYGARFNRWLCGHYKVSKVQG